MAVTDIGMDIGSSWTRVYVRGKGVVLTEPSVAAYDKDRNKYVAYGDDAYALIGRQSGNVTAVQPFRGGSISDFAVLEEILRYYIGKALGRRMLRKPYLCLCLPGSITEVERRAVKEAAYQAGARDVLLVPVTVAAAIGAGIDVTKPYGNLVADIGSGTTDIGILSMAGTVAESRIRTAGRSFDEAITRHIRRQHGLYISEPDAEDIKKRLGTAVKRPSQVRLEVSGRNVVTGDRAKITITQEEIRQAIRESTEEIADAVHSMLEKTPPELAADIVTRGIVLTGGGSLLGGLDAAIEERTGIHVMCAEEAQLCVVRGTGRYAETIAAVG